MKRRPMWAGSDGAFYNGRAITILNELRDKALADHKARTDLPVQDSKIIAATSRAALGIPEDRP